VKHKVLFTTQRGLRHQQSAIDSAPPELEIIMRRDPSRDELFELLPQVDFLISERVGVLDAELIAAGKNPCPEGRGIKLIQRLGRQTWDIDLDAAKSAGIPVCANPVPGCQLVAEHMLMSALGLVKRLREVTQIAEQAAPDWGQPQECTEDYFAYNWSRRDGIGGMFAKTVAILGFGEIGLELARRLRAFDCTVIYNKRQRIPARAEAELEIEYASLEDIQAKADILLNLLPDFPETHRLLNAEFFAACKPDLLLVHAGGGTTVDAESVAEALRTGQLGGAALDTFNWEPIRTDDPLVLLAREQPQANLLLTPHTAAGAQAEKGIEFKRQADYANILDVLNGQPLKNRVA
jgi:phosphoglycerate dehydrogenase-like enzyme